VKFLKQKPLLLLLLLLRSNQLAGYFFVSKVACRTWSTLENPESIDHVAFFMSFFILGFTSDGWFPQQICNQPLLPQDCLHLSIFYADNSTCSTWIKNSVEIMLLQFFQIFVFHVCMFFIFLSKFYGI